MTTFTRAADERPLSRAAYERQLLEILSKRFDQMTAERFQDARIEVSAEQPTGDPVRQQLGHHNLNPSAIEPVGFGQLARCQQCLD
jgi:hypothetical protein